MKTILFFGKKNYECVDKALRICKNNFKVNSYLGDNGSSIPFDDEMPDCDYIISFLSPWILPERVLIKAKCACLNFHPAPPEYPGTGCINFALYDGANVYGTTCHLMEHKVDSGKIVKVLRFPIFKTDTVESLLNRTYSYQIVLLYEIVDLILQDKKLPEEDEKWSAVSHTRKELNELSRIHWEMGKYEVNRRIRSTSYKQWQPSVDLYGHFFNYGEERE